MVRKFMKAMHRLHKGQRGMTGLETAIILIAFVTVAAVFGYAVLSAGIFSAEKGKETVYAGLEQAKSSMEVKGSVIAYGAPGDEGKVNDCEEVWTTGGTGVTASLTIGFGGGHSNQFVLSNDATNGFDGTTAPKVAYGVSATDDLSEKTFVNLYIRTDTDISGTGSDKLQLKLCTDATGDTAVETLDLPAITKDTWILITLNLANPEDDTGIQTVSLYYGVNLKGADNPVTIWVDNIVAGPPYTHVEMIVFTVANAVAGKPIDLTPTPDNKTVISYTDTRVYHSNVEWSVSFIGENDGDYLLEMGEQAQISVPLGFLATKPAANDSFGLQVKPPHGSVISIERTVPANIDAVMDLY